METNHEPSSESPDKTIATPTSSEEDDQHDQGSSRSTNNSHPQTKSYECSFCKRGFPTAQALGGHMNIHRKQKAKIKQPKTPVLVSSLPPPPQPPPPWFLRQDQQTDVVQEISSDNKFGQIIQQLPLVLEKPAVGSGDGDDDECRNDDLESSQSSLDLELRLGRHQPGKGSSSSATRNFFWVI